MRYIGIFQIMEPRNQLKADFETSITFEPLGIFDAVFTVVLRRMSSIILYVCLYLHWGLFKNLPYLTDFSLQLMACVSDIVQEILCNCCFFGHR